MNKVQIEGNPRADNDDAWKHILSLHLKDFVEFFWPNAYRDIDWSKPYEALEQELLAIKAPEAVGTRHVDKLFKVHLKSGQEQWLLLHVDVQHTKDEAFPERMFTYFYRIYDKYCQDVASMAVLADTNRSWRPNQYKRCIWGSEIIRTYETVKLIDFAEQKAELLAHDNPFAMVVLVQLEALETKPDDERRMLSKLEFFRGLKRHGWSTEKTRDMYRFLDNLLCLNPQFEVQFIEQARKIDEETGMNFMSAIERQGFEQGMQKGECTLLMRQLERKFRGTIPAQYKQKIEQASSDDLLRWGEQILVSDALEDVFKS